MGLFVQRESFLNFNKALKEMAYSPFKNLNLFSARHRNRLSSPTSSARPMPDNPTGKGARRWRGGWRQRCGSSPAPHGDDLLATGVETVLAGRPAPRAAMV